jgi:hypothetical protein
MERLPLQKRQIFSITNTQQDITLEELSPDGNNERLENKDVNKLSKSELNGLIKDLLSSIEPNKEYNQILDTKLYNGKAKNIDSLAAEALRKENREEAKRQAAILDNFLKVTAERLEDINYSVDYEKEDHDQCLLADFLFPTHQKGKLTYQEMQELKRYTKLYRELKADNQLRSATKDLKNDPMVGMEEEEDLNSKYGEVIKLAYAYQAEKTVKKDYDPEPKKTFGKMASVWLNNLEEDKRFKVYEEFDIFRDMFGLETALAQNEIRLSEDNISAKVGLIPLFNEAQKTREVVHGIESTLNGIDKQNSAIDVLMRGKEPSNVKARAIGEPAKNLGDLVTNWEGCYSCFGGEWPKLAKKLGDMKGPGDIFKGSDFVFGIDLEVKLKEQLEITKALLAKIRFASDIEFQLKANYCSLLRLGSLCPLELLFVIASLGGLLVYTWSEIFSANANFGLNFLRDLIMRGIVEPLLNLLQMSIRANISPLPNYALCTINSLISVQDIDKAGKQYGFTTEELSNWVNSGTADESKISALTKFSQTYFNNSNGEVGVDQQAVGTALEGALNNNGMKFLSTITNPLFGKGDALDSIEMIKSVIYDFIDWVSSQSDIVKYGLDALKALMGTQADTNIVLCTKIMALSQTLAFALGVYKAATSKGIEPCIPMKDDNGNLTNESPWDPWDPDPNSDFPMKEYFNSQPVYQEKARNNKSNKNKNTKPIRYLINPATDSRFNLTNCDRAKSSIISKGESLDFWRRVALGANVDNV